MISTTSGETDPPSNRLHRALLDYATYIIMGMTLSAIGPKLLGLADQARSTLAQISAIFSGNSLWLIGQLFETTGPQSLIVVLEKSMAVALLLFLGMSWYTRKMKTA
jgi:hypothetical protein